MIKTSDINVQGQAIVNLQQMTILELQVQSDESKSKDSKSIRETLSVGYGEEKRSNR